MNGIIGIHKPNFLWLQSLTLGIYLSPNKWATFSNECGKDRKSSCAAVTIFRFDSSLTSS